MPVPMVRGGCWKLDDLAEGGWDEDEDGGGEEGASEGGKPAMRATRGVNALLRDV